MATAFGTVGWPPPMALSALGVVHGVPGALRDPCAVVVAVGAAAWLTARGWGPEEESAAFHGQLVTILKAVHGSCAG
eukprot:9787128-Alexandrium_andersonii.AAC.1